jgi:predicted alpha/beta-hydrolase family hydrolase
MFHPFMDVVARELGERGIATLRYQFPYMEQRARRPDPPKLAHATVRAAVAAAAKLAPALPLVAGGKSFGGRMTSQAQAASPLPGVRGLAFLGFPLHPAGRPSDERGEHLFAVEVPMLFLQGSRDKLAELGLLSRLIERLGERASLRLIQDADHSFRVSARAGRKDADVKQTGHDGCACRLDRVGDLPARLTAASRLGRAETVRGALARLRRLDLAITGWRGGHEGVEQFVRSLRHLLHRTAERGLVCLGRPRESTQLAHELQGGRADLFIRGGRFEVMQRPDVSAHGTSSMHIGGARPPTADAHARIRSPPQSSRPSRAQRPSSARPRESGDPPRPWIPAFAGMSGIMPWVRSVCATGIALGQVHNQPNTTETCTCPRRSRISTDTSLA